MIRVPFEVELAKRIQNKECEGKIVTRDGRSARVICWDFSNILNIVSAISQEDGVENVSYNFNDGTCCLSSKCDEDLFIEIPEYMTFKDGDVIAYDNCSTISLIRGDFYKNDSGHTCSTVYVTLVDFLTINPVMIDDARLATEEEKTKLIDALKASKEPKAKEYLKRFFGIEEKKEYEFKPFDKVLVRDGNDVVWVADIFSNYSNNSEWKYKTVGGSSWEQCIPYNEQTAHLLGTTENYE